MFGYVPDAATVSLEAMIKLLRDKGWQDSDLAPKMRERIASHLDDQDRPLRWIALHALALIYPDQAEAAAAIARRIDAEQDALLLSLGINLVGRLPYEIADDVLAAASMELDELRRAWVKVHLNCHLHAATPHASAMTKMWFGDPGAHAELFRTAVSLLRDKFAFGAVEPLRGKAFDLVRRAAASLASQPDRASADASVVLAIDSLVQELYFASGAFEGNREKVRPTPAQRTVWYRDAVSALEQLACVASFPHTCYQLLETLEFLVAEDPVRIFRAIAATVKATSTFRFEQMGVEAAVRIVRRYLAEYRHMFATDPDLLSELRRVLEVFAQVGWPEALRLSYSLGDVFR
jgi:hypothetical protein